MVHGNTQTLKDAQEALASVMPRMHNTTQKFHDLKAVTVDPTSSDTITTDFGVPVADTDNWLRVTNGETVGPSLLEDHIAREKIHRFDHERIPERVVHARGTAAHGYFKVKGSGASKYTFAPVLTDSSRTTPVFVRFSTVQGPRGSADTVRDVRGFATKFYTEEGNWDLVGNNIPVFFIQDAIKFPDIVHALKPEPHNEVPTAQTAHNNFWDFVGLTPEASHMVMWTMSDRAIPRSYRMMQGFGVNTFTLYNATGERHFVKFHWIPELGVHSLMWDEALKIAGQDPDFHRKDLEEALTSGAYAKWTLAIQTIAEKDEHNFEFDILDATKIWPEELVPLEEVGELVLDRPVDQYFAETEQVAFCTSHVVPGIGFSDDPLLAGRNFSYFDTQISRLGINWEQLPINKPICPVMNHNRDGQMQANIVKGNVNYWPNRKGVVKPRDAKDGGYLEYPQRVSVGVKQRLRSPKFQEHYKQAQLFFNSLTPYERSHIVDALSFEISHCDDPVVPETYMKILNKIDGQLASMVAKNVGAPIPSESASGTIPEGFVSKPLSQLYHAPKTPTIKSRRIAMLITDGFNSAVLHSVKTTLEAGLANVFIISERRGLIKSETGTGPDIEADHHFDGQRSTLFDALVVPAGPALRLTKNGRAVHWVREAFGHCKAIGGIGEGAAFIQHCLPLLELEYSLTDSSIKEAYGVVTTGSYSVVGTTVLEIVPLAKTFPTQFAYQVSKHKIYEREMDGLTARVAF